MDVGTKLTESFYNLSSTIPAQSKRNFNTFINDLNNKIPQDVLKAELIASFNPRNIVEMKFKADLILHYQLYDEALELLKRGDNLIYTFKILKDWNFFKQTFNNISGDALVKEILPQMSYFARMKVLNRLSKTLVDENLANEYFESIENKYGILSANIILTSCSIDVIRTKIEKYNLILNYKQLLRIVKKKIEFLEYYFEYAHRDSRFGNNDKQKLLKAIFNLHQELFWKLSEKYKIVAKYGKRLSKKILKQKEHLLINNNSCNMAFAKRIIYQQLRKKPELFKKYILDRTSHDMKIFCSDYLAAYRDIGTLVTFVSEERRYQFLNYYFKEKFECELHENPKYVTEELLRLMPKELRNSVLEVKIKEDEDLIYLCAPEISFPLLMDKIRHCSDINKRTTYVEALYKTCDFNHDSQYLLKVLKYVEKRHRNDTVALRRFFECLVTWPNIEMLSTEHWNSLVAIKKLLTIQDQCVDETHFLVKWIGYLVNNNLDISEPMQKYFELVMDKSYYECNIFTKIPQHRKYCILELRKYIEKEQSKYKLERMLVKYLNFVCNYNQSDDVKDKIAFEEFLPLVETLSEKYSRELRNVITFYVRLYYTELNCIMWKHADEFLCDESLFSWCFLHHKDEILDNLNLLLQIQSVRRNKKFIRALSSYSFRNIPELVTRFCVHELSKSNYGSHDVYFKVDIMGILATINQNEFVRTAVPFNPSEDGKIDPNEPLDEIVLLEAVLKNTKMLLNPVDGLPIISKFCKGDYLKYALLPLYSVTLKLPENTAASFLMELHQKAVSVRKHTIHLSKTLFPEDAFCNFIKEQVASEKNPSLKTILFKKSLECAAISPIPKFWELLKITMHGIDEDDVEAHNLLLQIDSIPKQYRAAYIPEAYAQLNSNKNPDIQQKRISLICDIPTDVINQLDHQLLEIFLSQIMFKAVYNPSPDYWTKFIFYTTGERQLALFDFVLKQFDKYRNDINSENVSVNEQKLMHDFCKGVLIFHPDYSLVTKFSTLWFNIFVPEVNLGRHVYVTFIHSYAECGYDLKAFALKINELLKAFVTTYDGYLLDIFVGELIMLLGDRSNADVLQFIKLFSEDFSTVPICLVTIRILATFTPKKHELEERNEYLALIAKLQERPEKCIKVVLYNHLNIYMNPNNMDDKTWT